MHEHKVAEGDADMSGDREVCGRLHVNSNKLFIVNHKNNTCALNNV